MSLQIWKGPSGSGKTHNLFKFILKEADKHPDYNYIVLVPEQYTLSTQSELVRLSPKHGILNVDVLSFARLAYRLFEEIGFNDNAGIILDDMGKNLILRHLAAVHEKELGILSKNIKRLGYITEVKSGISEFMQYGISSDKIEEMIDASEKNGKGLLAGKLKDVKILFESFRKYIEDKYTTSEEILDRASRVAFSSEMLKRSVIVLDGFTGFTPVQYGFINSLMQLSKDFYVTVLTDTRDVVSYSGEHELFYLGYETENKLKRIAEENKIEILDDYSIIDEIPVRYSINNNSSDMLIHLERNLFRDYSKRFIADTYDMKTPTEAVNDGIHVFSALQPDEEARIVASNIHKLIREKGYRYKDIAVVTSDMEVYSPVIKRYFKKYNIPYFIDKSQPLLMNPFIEYLRALFSVINDNFSYQAMFRYLRSPLSGIKTDDIDRLENFVLKRGIRGKKSWEADWVEKYGRYYKNEHQNDVSSVNETRKIIIDLLSNFIDKIKNENNSEKNTPTISVNHVCSVLLEFLDNNHIEEHIKKLINDYEKTDDMFLAQHLKEYESVYDAIVTLINRMSELLGDERVTLDEYTELLDAGFEEIRIGIIPGVTDYVQIGDITRSRFKNLHALFIVGANDGKIPQTESGGGIFNEREKDMLLSNVENIKFSPSIREKAYTNRLYLYMLFSKPDEALYFTYSKIKDNGKPARPSYIIRHILDMFPTIKVENYDSTLYDYVWTLDSAKDAIAVNMNDYSRIEALMRYISLDFSVAENIRMYINAHFNEDIFKGTDAINASVAAILYGTALYSSVSKLEAYASCAYKYFCEYGLSLKEREIFEFSPMDRGNIFHSALENYGKMLAAENLGWLDISEEESDEIIKKSVEKALSEGNYDVLYSDFRNKYTIDRVLRITKRTINTLTKHLGSGDFIPRNFELAFSSLSNLSAFNFKLSDTERMHLRGKIDRVDTYEDAEHIYVKVIDYKSGSKDFTLAQVYRGLDLQLVVYLNAAKEILEKEAGGKEIVPAGILYYNIKDPVVKASKDMSDDDIAKLIMDNLSMKGLINEDETVFRHIDKDMELKSNIIPVSLKADGSEHLKSSQVVSKEQFNIISEYVNYKIQELGKEIISGKIKAEPHTVNGIDTEACKYCSFTHACKFIKNPELMDESATDTDDNVTYGNKSEDRTEIINKMAEVIWGSQTNS